MREDKAREEKPERSVRGGEKVEEKESGRERR